MLAPTTMEGRKTGLSRDSYYKGHLVTVTKENAALKQQVEALNRENRDLKKSLFEVSLRYEGALAQLESGQPADKAEKALSQPQAEAEAIAASAELALRTVANEGLGRFLEGGERTWNENTPQGHQSRDGSSSRQFEWECDLKGHSGAVYTVQFSPCGQYIASGSFDKTVRVWGFENQQEALCLAEHQLNVTDVAWSGDRCATLPSPAAAQLLSGCPRSYYVLPGQSRARQLYRLCCVLRLARPQQAPRLRWL